jgi:hypothetical protein
VARRWDKVKVDGHAAEVIEAAAGLYGSVCRWNRFAIPGVAGRALIRVPMSDLVCRWNRFAVPGVARSAITCAPV